MATAGATPPGPGSGRAGLGGGGDELGDNPLPRFLPHEIPPGIQLLCPTYPHLNLLAQPIAARRRLQPLAGSARSAAAEAPAAPAVSAAPDLSHKGQLQASARLALGLRAIATYDNKIYCGTTDPQAAFGFASVCTGRAPLSLDLELGYGVGRQVDLILELRVGLESDFGVAPGAAAGPRMFHLSPGARFFFSEGGRTKLFTTAQVVIDLARYQDAAGADRGTDVGVRNMSGLWFDLGRSYGVYAFVGETASFARWMRFELEGGIGVQGRYR